MRAVVREAEPRLYCDKLILQGLPSIPCQVVRAADGGWTVAGDYYTRSRLIPKFNEWLRSLEAYGLCVSTPEKREEACRSELHQKVRNFPPGNYRINSVPDSERVSYAWGAVGEVHVSPEKVVTGRLVSAGSHPNMPDYSGRVKWEGSCSLLEFWENHCDPSLMEPVGKGAIAPSLANKQ
jgi:hypothetical protein